MKPTVEIGPHKLYLGDCLEILPHLEKVDAVVTDPPYGIGFKSNYRIVSHSNICGDSNPDALRFACGIPARHSLYVFARWSEISTLAARPTSVVVWIKNNWSMGNLKHEHARQTEIILFWPGPDHCWQNGRPTDVVHAARTDNELHPTEKPIELMDKVVSWARGRVLDPFMGSGTTGVACVNQGRKFIGIEIEPKYFEIAVKRISAAHAQGRLFE